MVKYVVWDWNGTLLDDVQVCVAVSNQLLKEFDLPGFSDVEDYRAKFRFPIIDCYTDLGFDTSPEGNFVEASLRYIELYSAASAKCHLHERAPETVRALHEAGIRQVIISASQQDNLRAQLLPFGIDRYLDDSLGIDNIYAASKEHLALSWIAAQGLAADEVLFVGDTEHDYEIAQAIGADCLLFSGGHHSRSRLESLEAPVIDDLRDVLRFASASSGK